MTTILVVAPHPDDETLGCGGTLLRHVAAGDQVHWLIATAMSADQGFSAERIAGREAEIEAAARHYGFAGTHRLGLPTTRLDVLPKGDMVAKVSAVFHAVQPHTVYLPFRGDAHSDHAAVFDACAACTKWFRHPSVRRVRVYETLSETDSALLSETLPFQPNLFVDISAWLDAKITAMGLFAGEMGRAPFPRSEDVIRAQALVRGSQAGVMAAEAFMSLREVEA